MKGLRIVLLVQAVYLTILGLMFLFAPSAAEGAFQISLPDPALTPLYGQVVLTIALTAFLVASNLEKHIKLVWAFIFEQVGHILVFGYQLGGGIATFTQVGPPLIIAVIFLVLLSFFYRKATS
ncbi:MAG TPA: hypothetical protein VLA72_09030 [Anaerolineales bacterium]|nr:hypothetical protein [Anaerolineales bacterium]